MSLAHPDVSPLARQLLARLGRCGPAEDDVGEQLAEMGPSEMEAVAELIDRRLCVVIVGWKELFWVRLTDKGRAAIDRRSEATTQA